MAMIAFQALVVVTDYTYAAPAIIEPVFVHVTAAGHGFRQSPQHHFYNGSVGENLLRSQQQDGLHVGNHAIIAWTLSITPHLGLGCAIENVVLAAASNGFGAEVEATAGSLTVDDRQSHTRAATVHLAKASDIFVLCGLCDAIRARQSLPTFEGRVDGLDGAANAVSSTRGAMLANASIQNTTTLQGLPLCAVFDESRA
jgi:hypothetical protein